SHGVRRGSAGRHRKYSRRRDRGIDHRHHRNVRQRQPLVHVDGSDRLRPPDFNPALPSRRAARETSAGESLMLLARPRTLLLAALAGSVVLGVFQDRIDAYYVDVLSRIGINIVLAVSLNLINGHTG